MIPTMSHMLQWRRENGFRNAMEHTMMSDDNARALLLMFGMLR